MSVPRSGVGRARLAALVDENPVAVQVLGVCSALAVTKSLEPALVMSAALTAVLCASNVVISALRRVIPRDVRLIVQITVIASLVIVADLVLRAFFYEAARELSVFVALIVTNCVVLGRAEAVAMHRPVLESALDGLWNGLGYGLVLAAVGAVRELLGAGSLLGVSVLPLARDGGWFQPLEVLGAAPAAFFVLALVVWALRAWRGGGDEGEEAA